MFNPMTGEKSIIAELHQFDGHIYRIYADGTYEGFDNIQFVFKLWRPWMCRHVAQALIEEEERRISRAASSLSQETNTSSEDSEGGGQDSALPSANISGESNPNAGDR